MRVLIVRDAGVEFTDGRWEGCAVDGGEGGSVCGAGGGGGEGVRMWIRGTHYRGERESQAWEKQQRRWWGTDWSSEWRR